MSSRLTPRRISNSGTQPVQGDSSAPVGVAESKLVWVVWAFLIAGVGRIADVFPVLQAIPLAKILIGAGFVYMISDRHRLQRVNLADSPIIKTAFFLIVWAVVMTPLSIWVSNTIKFLVSTALIIVIEFIMVYKICGTWRPIRGALMALVLGVLVLAFTALITYGGGRAQIAGGRYDTNDLAYLIVTILPLAVCFASLAKGMSKIAWFGASAILCLAALLTQSRGGLIALLAVAAGLAFFPFSAAEQSQGRVKPGGVMARILALVVLGAGLWAFTPTDAKERLLTVFDLGSDYNMEASNQESRSYIWITKLGGVVSRPIGFGLDSSIAMDMQVGGQYRAAHNAVVQITTELGWLGMILYLRLYWLCWRQLGQAASKQREITAVDESTARSFAALARALRIGFVGNFVAAFFLSQAYSLLLWAMIPLAAGMTVWAQRNSVPLSAGGKNMEAKQSYSGHR